MGRRWFNEDSRFLDFAFGIACCGCAQLDVCVAPPRRVRHELDRVRDASTSNTFPGYVNPARLHNDCEVCYQLLSMCQGHAFLCVRSKRADTAAEKFMDDFLFNQVCHSERGGQAEPCHGHAFLRVRCKRADAAATVLPEYTQNTSSRLSRC